jgi:DNA-binding NtrC family response regulator
LTLALEKTGQNVTHTAELAGVGRRYIQRAMERHGLREGRNKSAPPPPETEP